MLCCGYTLTDFPISIRLTSLALWQFNDCPSASKATLMNMDKYFMWIHYERLHNHNKAKHNKTVCIFLVIYCTYVPKFQWVAVTKISRNLFRLLICHTEHGCILSQKSITGALYYHRLTLEWVSNYINYKVWDKIAYPFPNCNSATIWEYISNSIPHFTRHVITYPCYEWTQ